MIFNNYIPIILQRKYRQRIIDPKDAVNGLQNVPEDVEDVVHLLEVLELQIWQLNQVKNKENDCNTHAPAVDEYNFLFVFSIDRCFSISVVWVVIISHNLKNERNEVTHIGKHLEWEEPPSRFVQRVDYLLQTWMLLNLKSILVVDLKHEFC